MTNPKETVPEIGMGATIYHWSDRTACTVIAISKSGLEVTVQEDTAKRTDNLGMSESQSYEYTRNPEGPTHVFRLRKNGRWVAKGSPMKGSTELGLGTRRSYFDYSF